MNIKYLPIVLLATLLCGVNAALAVPHIAQGPAVNQGNGSTQTATLGSNVTAGDIVVVGCWGDSGAFTVCAPPTVNSGSETWINGATIPPDGHGSHGGFVQAAYYTLNANGGWKTATCNYMGGGNFNNGCMVIEIAGCAGCTNVAANTVVTNTSSTTLPGATIAPVAANGAVISSIIAETFSGLLGLTSSPFNITETSNAGILYTFSPTAGVLLSPTTSSSGSNVSSSWTLAITPPAKHRRIFGGIF